MSYSKKSRKKRKMKRKRKRVYLWLHTPCQRKYTFYLNLALYHQKLPKSAYHLFVRESWADMRKSNPVNNKMEPGEAFSIFAKRWAEMSSEGKAVYENKLEEEWSACSKLTQDYSNLRPEDQLQQLLAASGKLNLLHRMLPVLKAQGHKVNLFRCITLLTLADSYI